MLNTGITGTRNFKVKPEDTAKKVGSGSLEVLATPVCVAYMEETAWKSVADDLPKGCSTVGIKMHIEHLSPTSVGETVECESILNKVEDKKLTFTITARDRAGVIAKAEHERFIVLDEKFQKKVKSKYDSVQLLSQT